MKLLLVLLFWYVIPLLPLLWPVAFAIFAIIKRRISLQMLFLLITVEGACLGLFLFLFGPSDYEIRFVLPQNFRGGFIIVEDKNGVALRSEHGIYFVNVPQSRVVKVRSFKPFQNWHSESWEIPDNQGVKAIADATNGIPDKQDGVRGLGSESRGDLGSRIKYFYGTNAEAQVDFDAFALPAD